MTKSNSPSSGRIAAAELRRQLAADPAYQARIAKQEAERARWAKMWREASAPIFSDLNSINVNVNSVWDLVKTPMPYPEALPILLKHLKHGGYPDRVMAGLARAIADKPAVAFWSDLLRLYREASGPEEREGLAVALAASATRNQVGDLISLVSDNDLDESRILLVKPLARLGGDAGRAKLEELASSRVVGREVQAVLRRSARKKSPAID